MEDLCALSTPAGADEDGCGDIPRGVEVPVGWEADGRCFFLCFLRVDSLPLVSDAERLGEPGRLRYFLRGSVLFGRPMGVLVPFVEAPDGSLDGISFAFSFSLASSSFFRSSSACFSSSVASLSLCRILARSYIYREHEE